MLKTIAATTLILICTQSLQAASMPAITDLQGPEIHRIDPGKTLELIRRIKTAGGDVAS